MRITRVFEVARGRWHRRVVLGLAVALLPAMPAQATPPSPAMLMAEAQAWAEDIRDTGPIHADLSTMETIEGVDATFQAVRAHDFNGWFLLFTRLGDRPLVGYLGLSDNSSLDGAVAELDGANGADREQTAMFSLPFPEADASTGHEHLVDELLQAEEEQCVLLFDFVAMVIDCRVDVCAPTPGPVGAVAYFLAPFACKTSANKGLTWWSGQSVEYRQGVTYNAPSEHPWYTEFADFDYVSQTCAPPETIWAWNDNMPGQDYDSWKCYDFFIDGPKLRRVTYTLDIQWSDGVKQKVAYEREDRFMSELVSHGHSLPHGQYWVQEMTMTESLASRQLVTQWRFGRAFRVWYYTRCQTSGTSNTC